MMAIRARIQVVSREDVFRPGGGLSPKEVSAQFGAWASREIAQIDAANTTTVGHAIPHQTFVDGRESDDFRAVKPGGVIVATWALTSEVVRYVWDQIQGAKFRTGSGTFVKSQRIYADGVEVATPEDAVAAEEVVIASTVPYARKIEGQYSRQGGFWATNQNGIYHSIAALAAAKYGNVARIKFATREIVGGGTDLAAWVAGRVSKVTHEGKREKERARDSRQPAIVISFK